MSKKKPVRYPWNKWFRRRKFTLVRGKHFHCQPHSMSVQVRNAAAARDLWSSVLIEEDTLTVKTGEYE